MIISILLALTDISLPPVERQNAARTQVRALETLLDGKESGDLYEIRKREHIDRDKQQLVALGSLRPLLAAFDLRGKLMSVTLDEFGFVRAVSRGGQDVFPPRKLLGDDAGAIAIAKIFLQETSNIVIQHNNRWATKRTVDLSSRENGFIVQRATLSFNAEDQFERLRISPTHLIRVIEATQSATVPPDSVIVGKARQYLSKHVSNFEVVGEPEVGEPSLSPPGFSRIPEHQVAEDLVRRIEAMEAVPMISVVFRSSDRRRSALVAMDLPSLRLVTAGEAFTP